MYRFVALYWSDLSETARKSGEALERRLRIHHPDWREALSVDGLRIYDTGGRAGRLDRHLVARNGYRFPEGAVLGQVFHAHDHPDLLEGPPDFSGELAERVVASGGGHLIDACFGRYVAFVLDRARRRLHVLRAPQGELPCYAAKLGEISLYFSQLTDVLALLSQPFSIDWDEVANFITCQRTRPGRTGLREVVEIQAGYSRSESPRFVEWKRLWDPARIALRTPFATAAEGEKAIRDTVSATVNAFASRYDRVFHNLSGGLDSSVVAACLARAPKRPQIACLNYYSDDPEGDERRYARLAAANAGLPLFEARMNSSDIDLQRINSVVKGVAPSNYLYERPYRYFDASWLDAQNAEACFFGSGGDNVFFQPHTGLGAIDYFKTHGLGGAFLAICLDAARLTRSDLLSVVGRTLLSPLAKDNPAPEVFSNAACELISQNVRRMRDPATIFDLDLNSMSFPGKALHISIATNVPSYYEPLTPDEPPMERVLPLFAQPVVEACLRTPTWLLTVGGRDRGLARRAFAPLLPPEIAGRESKGGADNLFGRTLAANRPWIEPHLLDGLLADRGLLERDAVREALAAAGSGVSPNQVALLFLICAESWARDMVTGSVNSAVQAGR